MKIAIAGGHSKKVGGAIGFLNEYECDRAFVGQLIPALKAAGYEVVNCSNEADTVNGELAEEVRLANASGAELFVAIHFNAGGGTGTEAFTYPGSSSAEIARKMSANVAAALGIRDRGLKTANFYVLRNTSMPAILLEVCFVDNETDRDAWNRTSWKALTDAVVNTIGSPAKPQTGGQWVRYEAGWWWKYPDGSYPANQWKLIDGKWYWFDNNGYAVENCVLKIDGKWYAFDSNCRMIEGSITIDKNGALVLVEHK